jgi:hypothetical protein
MAAGGFAIVTKATSGNLNAAVVGPRSSEWRTLPAPPAGTVVVAVTSARTDALAVDGSSFRDFRLTGDGWLPSGPSVKVPIDYGSSS